MRIRINYATRYDYEREARSILQVLRVTPRSCDSQQVIDWRIDADADVRLRWREDAFGNIVHSLSTERPVDQLSLTVSGEVVTTDTSGVVAGSVERLPDEVYLRATDRTRPSEAIVAFARDADPGPEAGELARLHALLLAVHGHVAFETGATDVGTTAADAFALGRGVCQDLTHIFITGARALGIPARYVSGHLMRGEGHEVQDASHAWAEAVVPGLGWVGFDPANGISPTEAYVRVAMGLDYLDAAPVRGARSGGGAERMEVRLKVAPPEAFQSQSQRLGRMSQSQSQSQS
jgi:transglutaminase-like putative cysteine protease